MAFARAMTRCGAIFVLVLALAGAAAPAWADCADGIAALKARINGMSRTSPNYKPAQKELAKATAAQQDELTCDNEVARTWRIIRTPVPEPAPDEAQQ